MGQDYWVYILGGCVKGKNRYRIIGIDISENMITQARDKQVYDNIYNMNLVDLEIEEIINSCMFDYIVSGVFLEGRILIYLKNSNKWLNTI